MFILVVKAVILTVFHYINFAVLYAGTLFYRRPLFNWTIYPIHSIISNRFDDHQLRKDVQRFRTGKEWEQTLVRVAVSHLYPYINCSPRHISWSIADVQNRAVQL